MLSIIYFVKIPYKRGYAQCQLYAYAIKEDAEKIIVCDVATRKKITIKKDDLLSCETVPVSELKNMGV